MSSTIEREGFARETVVSLLLHNPTYADVEEDFYALRNNWRTLSKISNCGNLCVDFFTLNERLNTRLKSNTSFYDFVERFEEYWKQKDGVARLYNERPHTHHIIRCKYAYNLYVGCTNIFKPITTLHFLNILPCKTMLDLTMGWGGRLIGASIANIETYIGIDSNQNLKEPYSRICEFLKGKTQTKIKLMFEDALAIDYDKLEYDLILTSLPYYNIEKYSHFKPYHTKTEMNEYFYRPLLLRAFAGLAPDGRMALNINPEIYQFIHSFLGEPILQIPFPSRNRTEDYREYLYVWKK